MKSILLLFIVTFVFARVSTYYIDYYQEDLYETPIEKSSDWADEYTDDYSSSHYMSQREMRNDEVRSAYDYGDSNEVSPGMVTDSNEFKQGYKDSNYENTVGYRDYTSPRKMRDDEVDTVYDHGGSNEEVPRGLVAGGADLVEDYEDLRSQSPTAQTTWIDSIESHRDSNSEDPSGKIVGGIKFEPGNNGGCSSIYFRCQRDSTCVHLMNVCDGFIDCSDGEDERPSSCQKYTGSVAAKPIHQYPPPTSQPIHHYPPPTSQPIHHYPPTPPTSQPTHFYFPLPISQPIHHYPPPTPQPIRSTGCKLSEFLCKKDGKCIPLSYKCNKYLDCSDGEDEKLCTSILDTLPFRPGAMRTTTTTTTRPTSKKCRTYERRCSDYCRCLEYY